MIISSPNSFFASKNTTKGFQSDFNKIFYPDELDRIYIMKGGPGTGKSSFMRDIARFSESKNVTVEYFYCSSDPVSLDGIILKEPKIALIDGTSPHLVDPNFPGIVENIINLGNFWDINKLSENKREIIQLIKDKSKFYKRAYQFLSAYGEIGGEIFQLAKGCLDSKKMIENIFRQSEKVFRKNADGNEQIRNIATFGADGLVETLSYQNISEKIWVVEDHLFSGHLYLKELENLARNHNQNFMKSTSPVLPDYPNALYFSDSKSCFILGKRDYDFEIPGKEYHYINMKRFLNAEKVKENKQKNKFGLKCMAMLLEGASDAFREAKSIHKELESYYISAMDFEKMKEIKKMVQKAILDSIS